MHHIFSINFYLNNGLPTRNFRSPSQKRVHPTHGVTKNSRLATSQVSSRDTTATYRTMLTNQPYPPYSPAPSRMTRLSGRDGHQQRHLLHAGCTAPSPFASSDSLANDATRDHSDGIWNESQATVLQADSLALLTPSSKRRHLLMLQHQQRSSMDTDALDAEDEMDNVYPASPRIRLEAATPVTVAPRYDRVSAVEFFFFFFNWWFGVDRYPGMCKL